MFDAFETHFELPFPKVKYGNNEGTFKKAIRPIKIYLRIKRKILVERLRDSNDANWHHIWTHVTISSIDRSANSFTDWMDSTKSAKSKRLVEAPLSSRVASKLKFIWCRTKWSDASLRIRATMSKKSEWTTWKNLCLQSLRVQAMGILKIPWDHCLWYVLRWF